MATANEEIIARIQSGRMTPAQAEQLFAQAGINIAGGGGARTRYLESNPDANTRLMGLISGENAMPVGIEPLHQYERTALTAMGGSPSTIGNSALNPMATQFLQNADKYGGMASTALQSGMKGFDLNEVQQFYNPAQDAVTNRAVSRLTDSAKRTQQDMINRLSSRGSATMGDLYGAQQMGDIQKELVNKTGDIEAQGAYQNWTDAVSHMMQNRTNALNAGATYAGMINPMTSAATGAQNITGAAFNTGLQGLQAQQGAGQTIRGFNQGVADIAMGNYLGRNEFQNNLTNQAFGAFPTLNGGEMIQTAQQQQANAGTAIGGLVGGLAGWAGSSGMFGGGSSGGGGSSWVAPWQANKPLPWLGTSK